MSDISANLVPLPIIKAYGITNDYLVRKVEGGHVNQTYLVISKGVKYLLQQLGEVLGSPTLDCHSLLCRNLVQKGWEVPDLINSNPTKSKTISYYGRVWRCLKFIDNDSNGEPEINSELFSACGGLLGKWHKDVSKLDIKPTTPEKERHDIFREAKDLELNLRFLPNEAKVLGDKILGELNDLPKTPQGSQQIIHGDPKLDNVLFRGGKPFTLIDFDAVTVGSVWTDIGDMLRSLARKKLTAKNAEINLADIEHFMENYKKSAGPRNFVATDDIKNALSATKEISLEVAMRYLNDLDEQSNYLSWDSDNFASKLDNHIGKARLQINVVRTLNKLQKIIYTGTDPLGKRRLGNAHLQNM
jgi:hypothetical protein